MCNIAKRLRRKLGGNANNPTRLTEMEPAQSESMRVAEGLDELAE